jgi:hypothetical protein
MENFRKYFPHIFLRKKEVKNMLLFSLVKVYWHSRIFVNKKFTGDLPNG